MKFTLQEYQKKYPNEDACLERIFQSRYGSTTHCPKCSKETKFYRIKKRKCYECPHCGLQLHPLSGTPFENTKTCLTKWFYAIYLMSACKNGVSAKELQRHLGVTYKCAWRIGHKIRELMVFKFNAEKKLSGPVQVDETYVGGRKGAGTGRSLKKKIPVFGIVQAGGNVVAKVVENVKRGTIYPIIKENVERRAHIISDDFPMYDRLKKNAFTHTTINHSTYRYSNDAGETTNAIEGFWSILKRSIRGTHVWVSKHYLQKYVDEYVFRYNNRKATEPIFELILAKLSALIAYQ